MTAIKYLGTALNPAKKPVNAVLGNKMSQKRKLLEKNAHIIGEIVFQLSALNMLGNSGKTSQMLS